MSDSPQDAPLFPVPRPSHFFAYLARMKYIERWSLMRNTQVENIMEHSLQVATIAHALAVIRNTHYRARYGREVSPERAATLALFHDASEVITGDLATPIKYFNPAIKTAYREIEGVARARLLGMVPPEMRPFYEGLFTAGDADRDAWDLVRAADKLSAYLKCLEELKVGNSEFLQAEKSIKLELETHPLPEVRYFWEVYVPSFSLTLDELG